MKSRTVPLEEAVGLALSHDLTQIVAETGYKGARFSKGHVVRESDLSTLRAMGRANLSVLEIDADELHEDEAATRLAARLAGDGVTVKGPSEGKCVLIATRNGLLAYDEDGVHAVNEDEDMLLAALPSKVCVKTGDELAGCRVLPLAVREAQVARACTVAPVFAVHAFRPLQVGLVTTGREIAEGIVKDAFRPKLERKLELFGGILLGQLFARDETEEIRSAAAHFLDLGADLVLCTGGMSVDADDRTPGAIASLADDVVFRGVPALPGSMLMLARRENTWLVGAPACVVHDDVTTLDPLLARLFADLPPTRAETRRWGVGGLCARCPVCTYPRCIFGARA